MYTFNMYYTTYMNSKVLLQAIDSLYIYNYLIIILYIYNLKDRQWYSEFVSISSSITGGYNCITAQLRAGLLPHPRVLLVDQ